MIKTAEQILGKQQIEFMTKTAMKRKRLPSILLVSMQFIFIFSCSTKVQQKEIKEVFLWKSDFLGCQKLRTKAISEEIINKLHLEGVSESSFVKYFGNPNTRMERGGDVVLGYYFDALCRNGTIIDSADYCVAEYTFKGNKLLQRNYICQ